jgi:hypothetical protein
LLDFQKIERYLKITQERAEWVYNALCAVSEGIDRQSKDVVQECKKEIENNITPINEEILHRA